MKERNIDVSGECQGAHLLSVHRATATKANNETTEDFGWKGYNEMVSTKDSETIDAFSCVIPMQTERAYTGDCINVITQALQTEDSSLPQGLTIQNAHTELIQSSENAVVVVRNNMAYTKPCSRRPQWPGQ